MSKDAEPCNVFVPADPNDPNGTCDNCGWYLSSHWTPPGAKNPPKKK